MSLDIIRQLELLRRRIGHLETLEYPPFTPEGGICVRMLANATIATGFVVCVLQPAGGADLRVDLCPISGNEQDMPLGVAYDSGTAGNYMRVVIAGIAYVRPEIGVTAVRGYHIYASSTTAGRVAQVASPSTPTHWREVGHWIENGSGAAALTRAILHFN